jgi:hypothetical protein
MIHKLKLVKEGFVVTWNKNAFSDGDTGGQYGARGPVLPEALTRNFLIKFRHHG